MSHEDKTFKMSGGDDRDTPIKFYIGESYICSVDYDTHGSSGIEVAESMFRDIAKALGAVVVEIDEDDL